MYESGPAVHCTWLTDTTKCPDYIQQSKCQAHEAIGQLGLLTRLQSLDYFSRSWERNFSTSENRDKRPPDNRPTLSGIIATWRCVPAINRSLVCFTTAVALILDAAKQRTVAYLSGRGQRRQMFLLPDGVPVVSRTQHLEAGRRSRPPLHSTSAFWQVCHSARDAATACSFARPSSPRHRPVVQRHLTGPGIIHHPGADRPLRFPGSAPTLAPSPAVLGVPPPTMSIGSRHRPGTALGTAGDRPPPSRPSGDPTPITPVKGTYSREIESLDQDPKIATLDPGMRFSGYYHP